MCTTIDKFLNKKYKLHKADEFYEEYLKEIGLNYLTRKVAKSMPSTTQLIKINEDEYGLVTAIPIKSVTQRFIPGEESIQSTMDGRVIRNTFEIDENKLIEYQVDDKRSIKITREYFEDEMRSQSEIRDLTFKFWSVVENQNSHD